MGDKLVLMGVVGAPNGIRGAVRVKVFTGDPLALGDYGALKDAQGKRYTVKDIRPAKNVVVAQFAEVNSREAAEALTGSELFIDRSQLPDDELDEDEFFTEDLIGLLTKDESGAVSGRISAVHNFGAGDIIEVQPVRDDGSFSRKSELYSFTRQTVPEIDLAGGFVVLVPPGEIIAREGEDEE